LIKDDKKRNASKTAWEAPGDDGEDPRYPSTGEGELWPPGGSCELLEALEEVGSYLLPELVSEHPQKDEKETPFERVMRFRRLQRAKDLAKWKIRNAQKLRYRNKKPWEKVKKKKAQAWKAHHVNRPLRGPWAVYRKQWSSLKKDVRITKEEFEEIIEKCGGLLAVKRVRGVGGIISRDSLLVVGDDYKILYQGKDAVGVDPRTGRKIGLRTWWYERGYTAEEKDERLCTEVPKDPNS
jgi:hypothetical protein